MSPFGVEREDQHIWWSQSVQYVTLDPRSWVQPLCWVWRLLKKINKGLSPWYGNVATSE